MKKLVIITTCGNSDRLKETLDTLKEETADILIIDDGSDSEYDVGKHKLIRKEEGKGLTDSWNVGYKYFKDNNYDYCVLSNDDIIFPGRVPPDMWKGLEQFTMLGLLADPIGSGRFPGQFQNIETYLRAIDDYKDTITINNRLQKRHPSIRFLELYDNIVGEELYINGFCFSFNRDIIKAEYDKDILFNPMKINTGNEKELQKHRLLDKKAISIKSYVFHYKGQSFKENRQEIVNK